MLRRIELRELKSFPGYAVTNHGSVYSFPKSNRNKGGIWLSPSLVGNTNLTNNMYYAVQLRKGGKYYCRRIHRLVAEAFIPNPENKPEINHIDGNKLNNRVDNLEWATHQENIDHAWEVGLQSNTKREEGDIWWSENSGYYMTKKDGIQIRLSIQGHIDNNLDYSYFDDYHKHKEGDIWKVKNGWYKQVDGRRKRISVQEAGVGRKERESRQEGEVWFLESCSKWFMKLDGKTVYMTKELKKKYM